MVKLYSQISLINTYQECKDSYQNDKLKFLKNELEDLFNHVVVVTEPICQKINLKFMSIKWFLVICHPMQ